MKAWISIVILFFGSVASASDTIHLSPGRQRVVPVPNVRRAAIGNPKIADVKALPESNQVIITGVAPGSTDLILWSANGVKKTYLIQVSALGKSLFRETQQLLSGVEGIKVQQSGGKVIIDGQLYRSEDLERVAKIIELYPTVVNLTRVNQAALEYFSRQVLMALDQAGLSFIQVIPAGDTLFLEGEVEKKGDLERAERIASSIYANVSNRLTSGIARKSLILIDVKMMEVKRNAFRKAGIKWPGQVDGEGLLRLTSRGITATATLGKAATISLLALVDKGWAKVLANPKLLCRSGASASFLAGGEVPIPLIAERTANVIFKKYGIALEVKAETDQSHHVSMEIETRISDVDRAVEVQGFPGFVEQNVKTAVDLDMGQTVVLGGLIQNRASKNVSKVPFLGHIPILGELFKSRAFQNNQSEFVVLMTPRPGGPDAIDHKIERERSKATLHQMRQELELSILD